MVSDEQVVTGTFPHANVNEMLLISFINKIMCTYSVTEVLHAQEEEPRLSQCFVNIHEHTNRFAIQFVIYSPQM